MSKSELLDLLNTLTLKFEEFEPKLKLETKKKDLELLNNKITQEGFWDTPDEAQKISQTAAHLEAAIKKWSQIKTQLEELPELIEMSEENEISELEPEVLKLKEALELGETETLLGGIYDQHNVILSIHVGNGGQDAEDFCQILLRMYLRFAENKNFKTQILEESVSDAGLKSATIEIKGPAAYGLLKSEHGVHRLIRLSPFNAKSLRQTSFAKIEILPEIENDTEINLEEKDLRVDVFRSSGAGGQSVNTTDSAVRITYLPLNLVVTCQNERSQQQNKQNALKVLKSRLAQLQLEQQAEKIDQLRGGKLDANFGSQIRTYTLQPYKLVKDHRTDYEESSPEKVFDGHLEGFVKNFLQKS